MTEVERLEKELEIAKRKEQLERKIYSSKCPLCGANLTYSIRHQSQDGGYSGINFVRIYCPKCQCFGIGQEYNHDYCRSTCTPKEEDIKDLNSTWYKIYDYAVKETKQ